MPSFLSSGMIVPLTASSLYWQVSYWIPSLSFGVSHPCRTDSLISAAKERSVVRPAGTNRLGDCSSIFVLLSTWDVPSNCGIPALSRQAVNVAFTHRLDNTTSTWLSWVSVWHAACDATL